MLHQLYWIHIKCSLFSSFKFNALGSSHFWSALLAASLLLLGSPIFQHWDFFLLGPSNTYTSSDQTGLSSPPLPMQRPYTTLAYKHPVLLPLTSELLSLSLHFAYPLTVLPVVFHFQLPLSPLTRSVFFNGMRKAFKPEVLNFSNISQSIL